MKQYIFIAEGFEEIEAITTIDILRRAQLQVISVSITNQKTVTGAHGITIQTDATFDQITDFAQAQTIILPGGMPGTTNLEAYQPLIKLISQSYKSGKYIAAICAAPSILGKMRLLRNEEATAYPGFEEHLEDAVLSKQKVVRSGKMITARGPGATIQFALKIVETIKGQEAAQQIAADLIID